VSNAPCYASMRSDHSAIITPRSPYMADTIHTYHNKRFVWLWTYSNWSSNRSREASEAMCHVSSPVKWSATINIHPNKIV